MKNHITIISIVAIVAILGMVVAITTSMNPGASTAGTNSVGQAYLPSGVTYSCSDSDGGQNFYVKGTTTSVQLSSGISDVAAQKVTARAVKSAQTPSSYSYTDECILYGGEVVDSCYGLNCILREYYCDETDLPDKIASNGHSVYPGACVDGEQKDNFFDLELLIIAQPETAYVGQEVELELSVRNNGNVPGYITGGMEYICPVGDDSCSGTGWGQSISTSPKILPGEIVTFKKRVSMDSPGDWVLTFRRSGIGVLDGENFTDINPDNNEQTIYMTALDGKVFGYANIDQPLANSEQGFGTLISPEDSEALEEWTLNWNGANYQTHEEVLLSNENTIKPVTSLSAEGEYDYDMNVYAEITKDAIRYCYRFDTPIDLSLTSQEPFDLTFAGEEMKITAINDNNSLTIRHGLEMFFMAGDSYFYEPNYTITLDRTDSSSAVITVNGVTEVVNEGSTKNIAGIQIKVLEVFDQPGIEEDSATLLIGENVERTYSYGDAFIGQDEDDPDWVWALSDLYGSHPQICVENDFQRLNSNQNPITVNNYYGLPFDYAWLMFEAFTVDYEDFTFITVSYDIEDLSGPGSEGSAVADVIVLDSTLDEGFVLDPYKMDSTPYTNEITTDKIFIYNDNSSGISFYFRDANDDNRKKWFGSKYALPVSFGNILNSEGVADIKLSLEGISSQPDSMYLKLGSPLENDDVRILLGTRDSAPYDFDGIGAIPQIAEPDELLYDVVGIGMVYDNLRTRYGMKVMSPQSNSGFDQETFWVPAERLRNEFSFYDPTSPSSGDGGGAGGN